jgi:hypothetical protein
MYNVVDQNIYTWQRKVIFVASLVQILKIHVNSDLPLIPQRTMLDTHCGYLTTSKKLAFYCFLNSILTLIKISGWVFLNFYLTDLQPSTSGILYTTIFISKLGISS